MFKTVRFGSTPNPDCRVLFFYSDREISAAEPSEVQLAVKRASCTFKAGAWEEVHLPDSPRTLLVCLGKEGDFSHATLRSVMLATMGRLSGVCAERVQFEFDRDPEDAFATGRVMGESLGRANWNRMRYPGSAAKPNTWVDMTVWSPNEDLHEGMIEGGKLADAINLCRDLVETPADIATPQHMAHIAQALAERTGMDYRCIEGDELHSEKLMGLATVGRASVNPPCLIRIAYTPEGGSDEAPLVILGKTITYDTGGLSLKVGGNMRGMKGDKGGGCAVLGAMQAIAEVIKPNFPVVGLLVAAENAVAGNAYRPDDVITYRNGVTVEVTNTDAEGRLVLADGLIWASEVEKAGELVDMATLTGGVVVALGDAFAGVFGRHEDLIDSLREAGKACGDEIWPLPVTEPYRDMMRSPVADILNSAPVRAAHPVQGAAFLSYFVPDDTRWAHIDIAGVSEIDKDRSDRVAGPTGFGVALMAEYARQRNASRG